MDFAWLDYTKPILKLLHRLRGITSLSPASAKSPPTPRCVLTAFAEATERSILHGHQGWSLRLPSLTHRYGVVFLRCPPQDVASLPRLCQHGKATTATPIRVALLLYKILFLFLLTTLACNSLNTGIKRESSYGRACFVVPL